MQKKMTYEQAMQRLEQLVQEIEQGTLGVDHLIDRVKEAQTLLKFCRNKLVQVEKDIKEILPDEDK